VGLSLTRDMAMARAVLLSRVRARLGRLRGRVSRRMASRAVSHMVTLYRSSSS
jgi:hypothetical protein